MTPENNLWVAALKLMRYKMLIQIGENDKYPSLDINDVNEILTVANMPLIVPSEIETPELKIIDVERD